MRFPPSRAGRAWFAALAASLALTACAGLKDLAALDSALQQRFGVMPQLQLNNRTHLSVTFRNDESAAKLDPAGRVELAHDVALFVRDHYPEASQLEDISVAFGTVSKTGPLTITRTDAAYRFSMAELR